MVINVSARKTFLKNIFIQICLPLCAFVGLFMLYTSITSASFYDLSKQVYQADSKILSEEQRQFNEKRAEAAKILAKQHENEYNNEFHLLFIFVKSTDNPKLTEKLQTLLGSLFETANFESHESLTIHFVCDEEGREKADFYLKDKLSHPNFDLRVKFHDVDFFVSELRMKIATVQSVLGNNHPKYEDIIFLLSLSLHKILPLNIHKIVQLDLDLKFTTNLRAIWKEFDNFQHTNMFGLAHENQPVYRHLLWKYRDENPGTKVGNPAPNGNPGYNSGVLLLNLDKIRMNDKYNSYLEPENVQKLVEKYRFKGHLGDQDFYTLLSFERPEFFYTLSCGWNKQLCQWWRDKGYSEVFDKYFSCVDDEVKIWHGNCDTPFPE